MDLWAPVTCSGWDIEEFDDKARGTVGALVGMFVVSLMSFRQSLILFDSCPSHTPY